MAPTIRVQSEDFDVSAELAELRRAAPGAGALASFVGVVRGENERLRILEMELEHYPGMTERSITAIVEQARARWGTLAVRVVHRVGRLRPGDQIVLVAVAGAHRGEAFAACEYVMDYLKTRAPFWKKETTSGGARWVEPRASDDTAAARWKA